MCVQDEHVDNVAGRDTRHKEAESSLVPRPSHVFQCTRSTHTRMKDKVHVGGEFDDATASILWGGHTSGMEESTQKN